jgi:anionic cell wall polymer biosynthesis LytR-Cps2A-Psr (LCP) family protein
MKKSVKIGILIVFLAIILVFGLVYFLTPDRLNILVVGSDQRGEERARSDVLMVFSIPKSPAKKTSLITIPRDSRVDIPDYGLDKITHAYVYGEREKGTILGNISLTEKTVESFLDIPMHGSLEFTFESFKEIVDMVGGVWTKDGYYDGEKALNLVRNRYRPGGDFARTEDQREIVTAMLTKMKDKDTALAVYNYLSESKKARIKIDKIKTTIFGAVTFLRRFGQLSLGEIKTAFIPGHGETIYSKKFGANLYYWVVNEGEKEKLIEEALK